ncbi:dockerin type I domain-containing protein [Lacipirellula parvula]|uniref:PEP-CTERM protein-sorting domain-containing protein n=1 Tax=Lacipirellula parvula TaxID=2650471 RepID=A0A5K7XID4_9BACT|nr:dockerin type I domain-containing protein [Lacipirellula parvula]BBO36165.1 hypothetical protein PLANPX_5777 [Lacipirellula parvula]
MLRSGRQQFIVALAWWSLCSAMLIGVGTQPAAAGPVASFDDVEFWVGTGSNRAVVAIEWLTGTTERTTLAWGFRWDGAATGQTLLNAVVTADPRLFAKSGGFGGGLGSSLYGLGYDDGDGAFALDDGTTFNEAGIAQVSGPADRAQAVDPADYYNEGWFRGFWNYGYSHTNPFAGGSWTASQVGMSSRVLQDGDWESWAYHPAVNQAGFQQFADNPFAAPAPAIVGSADFNGDGGVDGADFLAWQRGYGITTGAELNQGDANGDGGVDAADLQWWRDAFSQATTPPAAISAAAVPEPTSLGLALMAFAAAAVRRRINRIHGTLAWKHPTR